MNSRKKLTNLIANGQLEKVFTLIFNSYFIQFSKKDQKSLTNLSSRFHRIKRERQNNLIEDEVYRIEISRINDALLDVITKPSTKNTTNLSLGSKWLWLIVGLLVIGISGYGVYTKFEPISPNPNRMGQGQGIEMLVDNENDSLVQPPNKSTDEEKSAPSKSPKKPIQEP